MILLMQPLWAHLRCHHHALGGRHELRDASGFVVTWVQLVGPAHKSTSTIIS